MATYFQTVLGKVIGTQNERELKRLDDRLKGKPLPKGVFYVLRNVLTFHSICVNYML